MAQLIFDNISLRQARELAYWYQHIGEDTAIIWFDEDCDGEKAPSIKSITIHDQVVTADCVKSNIIK